MTLNELWAKAINEISFEDVRAFCAKQVREHVLVDYKKEPSSKDAQHQIAKVIAAFANTQGGVILWGVAENRERPDHPDPDPHGEELGSDLFDNIKDACAKKIVPSISPEVTGFLENPAKPGFGFAVVRVPLGDLVPYTVDRITYERVVDSSEPRAADLTTIVNLLARRNLAQKEGEDRRASALERIERAVVGKRPASARDPCESLPRGLLLSAGPSFSTAARCSPQELLEKCRDANTAANFDTYLIHDKWMVPVAEGLFWHFKGRQALNVDTCGNVVYFDQSLVERDEEKGKQDEEMGKQFVPLGELARLLSRCVHFVCKLNEGLGWRAPVTCDVTFIGTRNLRLEWRARAFSRPGGRASSEHDEKIEARAAVRLPEDADGAIDGLLGDLQWAWGVDEPLSADKLGLT